MLIDIPTAIEYLNSSRPVAVPTETVWGLAAKVNDTQAIEHVFRLKGRPATNPVIVHISSFDSLFECTTLDPSLIEPLVHHFWPGGLTLVVPVDNSIPMIARAGLPTAAFRMPNHPVPLAIIDAVGPFIAPSANISGKPSATTPTHIEHDFGSSFPIVATSIPCCYGIESTIVIWKEQWYIGRYGAIAPEAIADVLGYTPPYYTTTSGPICPGQILRHYAPQAKLFLTTSFEGQYDGILGFDDRTYPISNIISLGAASDPETVSKRLYHALRLLDELGLRAVGVDMNIPHAGPWTAIIDRLSRAASH